MSMAVRPTIQLGHPSLKAKNKIITDFAAPELKQLITDLRDTMHAVGLVGMASPQISENYQIFVTGPRETKARPADQADQFRVYINPIIIKSSCEQSVAFEGCGSVAEAHLFGPVKRSKEITIEAFDEHGRKFRLTCDGLLARIIQHEYDHVQGIEFIEKVSDYEQLMAEAYYMTQIRNSSAQIEAGRITLLKCEYV